MFIINPSSLTISIFIAIITLNLTPITRFGPLIAIVHWLPCDTMCLVKGRNAWSTLLDVFVHPSSTSLVVVRYLKAISYTSSIYLRRLPIHLMPPPRWLWTTMHMETCPGRHHQTRRILTISSNRSRHVALWVDGRWWTPPILSTETVVSVPLHAKSAKYRSIWLCHRILPRNLLRDFAVVGAGPCKIVLTLSELTTIPSLLTVCPNNALLGTPNMHFVGFKRNQVLYAWRGAETHWW